MEVWNHHPDRQPGVQTWDLEGSIKKCENRVPLPKLRYVHDARQREETHAGHSSGPFSRTWPCGVM